jgi:hypothetical protein
MAIKKGNGIVYCMNLTLLRNFLLKYVMLTNFDN